MKIEIIPTILVKTFDEVKEKIRAVEKYVNWVQLDIMDGIFVENKTWPYTEGSPKDLKTVYPVKSREAGSPEAKFNRVKFEAHLMVKNPEKIIDGWLEVADRVIIHYESTENIQEIIEKVHNWRPAASSASRRARLNAQSAFGGKEIGIALNPETHPTAIEKYLKDLDLVLLMSVQPGKGGQEFKEWILEKADILKQKGFKGNIEIDGGINEKNIKEAVEHGINLICVGTHIYQSGDTKQAIEKLKEV